MSFKSYELQIKCACCVKTLLFYKEPNELELFQRGFYLWGKNADKSLYCTCFECTEEMTKFADKSKITERKEYNLKENKTNKIETHPNDLYFERVV